MNSFDMSMLVVACLALFLFGILLLFLRGVVLWFFRIDEIVKTLHRIAASLERAYGVPEPPKPTKATKPPA